VQTQFIYKEPLTMKSIPYLLLIIVLLGIVPAYSQTTLGEKKFINLASAKKMVEAAEAEAAKNNWALSFTVLDDGGNLVYFERMDGASLGTIAVSQSKARTSASFKAPSRVFQDGMSKGHTELLTLGITAFAGGLPIMVDGKFVGAMGGSGASPDQDEQCVQAGINALSKP
jgi:glc operon protein GlcG